MLAQITEALRRGDIAVALETARAAVASQPEDADAQHVLGLCLQRAGDRDGARAAIDEAIRLAPERSLFQLSRGSLALGQKDLARAAQGMQDAVRLDPNQLAAYVGLVHLALAQGDGEDAERQLKLAQRVDAGHPQVLVAQGHVAQFAGRGDEAVRCFSAAVTADPGYALAQVSLGLAFLARGHWAFAEQSLRNAVALEPNNPGVLRALVDACRRQGKNTDALAAVEQLIAVQPDAPARAVRAELRLAEGRAEEALQDLLLVLDEQPANPGVVNAAVALLMNAGRGEEAVARLESALAQAPQDLFWSLRLGLAVNLGEDLAALLARWQTSAPDNPIAHESAALYYEDRGDAATAQAHADRALALSPTMIASHLVKIRGDLVERPQAVLERLAGLEPTATGADLQRMVLGWRGMAYDRLGQYADAAPSWVAMSRRVFTRAPLARAQPADQVPAGAGAGHLVWAPCGSPVEPVLRALQPLLGERLLIDRNGPQGRADGFGLDRAAPGTAEAGSATRWRAALLERGRDPATVVDWLPHFDAYTGAALAGAHLVAVLIDPREAFLNWLVFGSAQDCPFIPETAQAADWLASWLEALADHVQAHPEAVTVVRMDAVAADAAAVAATLQATLALPEAPSAALLAEPLRVRGGLPGQFPAGHWRHYREVFANEFARLGGVAQRLGYPAD